MRSSAKPVSFEAPFLGQQRPGMQDRLLLEIVAEAEIAEHLEEGVVPRGVADIVEIVVLAPGANAFLRCCRTRIIAGFNAGKQVLELHHAGVREHQRGVVSRHQRAGRLDRVTLLFKITKEG